MKIVRGSRSTVVRQVVAGVIATLVATAAWGVSASAAPVAETLPTITTSSSSVDAMAVGDLGEVTNVFEPYHDVVAAEIASNSNGQRVLGFIERTDNGFDVKVALSATMTASWSTFETIDQIPIGANDPYIAVSIGANQVSTVIWTNANRDTITGSWHSIGNPEFETPITLSSERSSIAYLDVGPLSNSAFITFRGFDSSFSANRAYALDWYHTAATAPTVETVSSGSTKPVLDVLQVTNGAEDALIAWIQDPAASTTDTVWGNVWDGSTWYGVEQLSTSTGATPLSTLAVGHTGRSDVSTPDRMIVGWFEADTNIIIKYFEPSSDAWGPAPSTLQSGLNARGITKDLVIIANPTQPNGIVAWTEKDGTQARHRAVITGPGSLSTPTWISNLTSAVFNSSIPARDNGLVGSMDSVGNATVMWRYPGTEVTVIRFTKSGAGTGTWGPETTYGGTDEFQISGWGSFGVTEGATSQTIWVLAGLSSVKALGTATWSGSSLSVPALITDHSQFDAGSGLVLGVTPDGHTLAVWLDAPREKIVYSTKASTSNSWSAPAALIDPEWVRDLRLVNDGSGNFALLWRERASSVSSVVARVASWNQSSGWSTPTTVSSASISIDCLTPVMTSSGAGFAIYTDNSDNTKLYGATFNSTGLANIGSVIASDSTGSFTCGGVPYKYDLELVDDGRYMVAFDAIFGLGYEVYTVDGTVASGSTVTPVRRSPAASGTREYYAPTLASKPDGTVALAWNDLDSAATSEVQTVAVGQIGSTFGAPITFDMTTGSFNVDTMNAAYLADGSLVITALLVASQYDVWSMHLASGSTTPTTALLAADVNDRYSVGYDSSSFNVLVFDDSDGSINYHRLTSGSTAWTTTSVARPTNTVTTNFAVAVAGQADAIGWILDNSSTTWPQVAVRSVAAPAAVTGLITLSPQRIMNTRPTGKIGSRTGTTAATTFNVYGKGGLPSSGINAVVLNVTVVDPEVGNEGGYLSVYPCASGLPDVSNLNFTNGTTIPNTVIAPVDPSGNICFYSYGKTHVLTDVSGYFPTS